MGKWGIGSNNLEIVGPMKLGRKGLRERETSGGSALKGGRAFDFANFRKEKRNSVESDYKKNLIIFKNNNPTIRPRQPRFPVSNTWPIPDASFQTPFIPSLLRQLLNSLCFFHFYLFIL